MKSKVCCLCGQKITTYGNNPWPLPGDVCCDTCDKEFVLPIRMFFMGITKGALIVTPSGSVMSRKPQNEKFTLGELQHMVGGYIEKYPKKEDEYKGITIFMDEEGLLKELEPNRIARHMTGGLVNAVGRVVFVSDALLED